MNGDDSTKTRNTPKVEISVRNFGPIAEADLDLRPLTVFVGPSNTGKTYLSVLTYALHRVFEGFSEFLSLYNLECLVDNWYCGAPGRHNTTSEGNGQTKQRATARILGSAPGGS